MVASTLLSTNVFVDAAQTGDPTTDGEYQNTNWNPAVTEKLLMILTGLPLLYPKE